MRKYVALLRGVNVSGKNKVSMSELSNAFEGIGFSDVVTYINSGNVIFSSSIKNQNKLIMEIESIILEKFKLKIPVTVLTMKELADIFVNAPDWWNTGNKEIYDNTIFVIPPMSVEEVYAEIGEAVPEYEKIACHGNVIFWSATLKTFNKARWAKIANSSVNNNVTIRNANTVKKLFEIAGGKK